MLPETLSLACSDRAPNVSVGHEAKGFKTGGGGSSWSADMLYKIRSDVVFFSIVKLLFDALYVTVKYFDCFRIE